MKRMTQEQRCWFIIRTAKQEKRRSRATFVKYCSRVNRNWYNDGQHGACPYPDVYIGASLGIPDKTQKNLLPAPEILSLQENFRETVEFIDNFREMAINHKNGVIVDFRTIRSLCPGAALVLAAELDRWRKVRNINLRPFKKREWSPTVRRLLTEMGLFNLLNLTKRRTTCKKIGQEFIRFKTGNSSEGEVAAKLMHCISPVIGTTIPNQNAMYDALSEAITNVVQHAYPDGHVWKYATIDRQWWISGSFNWNTNELIVMCYDQGVGIPNTLMKKKEIWHPIEKLLGESREHADMIEAAFESGKTQTDKVNRGKGLLQVLHLATVNQGSVRVVSCNGEITLGPDGNVIDKTIHFKPLNGTYIQWNLSLNGEHHVCTTN